MRYLAYALLALTLLLWVVWMFAFPAHRIESYAEGALTKGAVRTDIVNLKKSLFPGLKIEAADFYRNEERTISIEGITVSPELLKSMTGFGLNAIIKGRVAGGGLTAGISIKKGTIKADVVFDSIRVEDMQILKTYGISGSGILEGQYRLAGGASSLRFSIDNAEFSPAIISGKSVPLDLFKTVHGAVGIYNGSVVLESVSFEGDGVYARAKGELKSGVFEGVLELMPEQDVLPDAVVSAMVGEQYRVSKGRYEIPISSEVEF